MAETPEARPSSSSSLPLGIDLEPFVFALVVMVPSSLLSAPLAPAPVGFLVALWIPFVLTGATLLVTESLADEGTPDNVVFAAMSFSFLFAALYFESVYLLFVIFPLTLVYGIVVLARSYATRSRPAA